MHEYGANFGHGHLRLFFPPTVVVATSGMPEPAATGRCGGASPPNRVSRTRLGRTPLWPPGNSARPTNAPHALGPASPGKSPPARWSGVTSFPPAGPAIAPPAAAPAPTVT